MAFSFYTLMKKHIVKVQYIFEGYYEVMADNKNGAETIVDRDCGLVMGTGIQAYNDDVKDWNFNMHPETKIVSVKQLKKIK